MAEKRFLTHKCGHQIEAVSRLTAEEFAVEISRYSQKTCMDCWNAQKNPDDYAYDARAGAIVRRDISRQVARAIDDPTAFVVKSDYALNENVHDGNGYGN